MKIHSHGSSPSSLKVYSYPGGTLHLAPWAAIFVGLIWIWLTCLTHGYSGIWSQRGLVLMGFGFLIISVGVYTEWSFRNHPGSIIVDEKGLTFTLPWKRQRRFLWHEIRGVRCLARRFNQDISFWEIQGPTPKDRIVITWELKGYKEFLQIIKERATNCQHFDEIV